ncbi:MAG: DNA-processing protein DprA [Eubacteriales bacterium]|nr:DNA-processing protein DprA [Eubacteriales bacterium]
MNTLFLSEKDRKKITEAERSAGVMAGYGVNFCTPLQEEYPDALREISGRPAVLYYKGDIRMLNQHRSIAVVGSRNFSEKGRKLSRYTGRAVARAGMTLVNGLALGCDTESLQGALTEHGRCAVILPCGLDFVCPAGNRDLAEGILKNGGCLLSEYPVGMRPEKYRYVERDRLQSGISQGVFIVEAEEKSGTMHTAESAVRQFRRLACYHYALLERASGNRLLEESGKAQAIHSQTELNDFIEGICNESPHAQLTLQF